ncbi:hypothetical protein E0I26_02120 [Flavobacterium rhamnosiphilum]|uniref:Uncharacterized protein n=1 Tax=Flavobacterium rhamnosiphilum TaxID=2541724 RepID=A0A4R5FDJ2_9FLAO|nr:hypothetical protein [Flavobacterium rhamnosiphilum]TDE46905.1 hypothetical protein E0I26_02120 [Flavobacterium rhamnosiphilum]
MKKKLEADLISIAHRVLQLKNKSDINQLYLETQKLYEKLSVLRFVDEHFSEAKPTIGAAEVEQKMESIFDKMDSVQPEIKAVVEETVAEEIVETPLEETIETADISESETNIVEEETVEVPLEETIETADTTESETSIVEEETVETPLEETISNEEITAEEEKEEEPIIEEEIVAEEKETSEPETAAFTPAFELSQEEEVETELEVPKKMEPVQISFEDLLGGNYHDTQFVKVQQIENIPTAVVIETSKEIVAEEENVLPVKEAVEPKTVSLNEKLAKGINIDLNDRIAFIKHLFGNSSEDYNRVLNQLITFDTFYETRDFVQEMVKPDYNNWEGKQEYEERFMDVIEKKFL